MIGTDVRNALFPDGHPLGKRLVLVEGRREVASGSVPMQSNYARKFLGGSYTLSRRWLIRETINFYCAIDHGRNDA